MRFLLPLLLAVAPARAAGVDDWMKGGYSELDFRTVPAASLPSPAQPAAFLDATVVLLKGGAWTAEAAEERVAEAARILAQCGIAARRVSLVLAAPPKGKRAWARFAGGSDSVSALRAAAPVRGELLVFLTGDFPDDTDAGFSRAEWTNGRDLQPDLYGSVYLGDRALSPEYLAENAASPYSLLAHEILHVLTREGRHLNAAEPNLLNNTWSGRSNFIRPDHCAAALASPLLKPK